MMKDAPRIVDDANGGGDQEPFKLLKKMLANLHQLVPSASEAGLLPGNAVWKAIEDIVSLATSISPEEWEAMKENGNSLMENRSWFAPVYGEFIGKVEVEEAVPFFKLIDKEKAFDVKALTPWGLSAYDRVMDLFENLDLSQAKHLIMLGSGTLPVTLMNIHERTSIPTLTAVDTDPVAIESMQRLCSVLGWTRIHAQRGNALDVQYAGADVIYVANLISPKLAVLETIGAQVKSGTSVIVREAVGVGELFAESITNHGVPSGFRLEGLGGCHSGKFHSRHVFLVKE